MLQVTVASPVCPALLDSQVAKDLLEILAQLEVQVLEVDLE